MGSGYFEGAAGAAGVAAGGVTFLCFFTAFFVVVVAVPAAGAAGAAGVAGVCAIEMPAVASANESPRMVEVIFVMMFVRFPFRGVYVVASVLIDAGDY